jgi:hypothetical protein
MTYTPMTSEFFPRYKSGELYFGPELEIARGRGRGLGYTLESEVKSQIRRLFGGKVHFKGDCSLTNGFEINFMPMTYGYFMEQPWEDFFKVLTDNDFQDGAGGAGLHVHVSKEFFGYKDSVLASMVAFYDTFWKEMYKISRRSGGNIHWAQRPNVAGWHSESDVLETVRHYRGAVNVAPRDTVEFRVFKGTNQRTTFLAAIQITKAIVELSKEKDYKYIRSMVWPEFVDRCREYSELMTYLDSKGLAPPPLRAKGQAALAMADTDTFWMMRP